MNDATPGPASDPASGSASGPASGPASRAEIAWEQQRAEAAAAYQREVDTYVDLVRSRFPRQWPRLVTDARREAAGLHRRRDTGYRPADGPGRLPTDWRNGLDADEVALLATQLRVMVAPRLLVNSARCQACGDVLVSEHRHAFRSCRCGRVSVDGGLDYARRCWAADGGPGFEELSQYESIEQVCERLIDAGW